MCGENMVVADWWVGTVGTIFCWQNQVRRKESGVCMECFATQIQSEELPIMRQKIWAQHVSFGILFGIIFRLKSLLRKWHVWNASTGQWNADANCHCLAAPSVIHVLGRHPQALFQNSFSPWGLKIDQWHQVEETLSLATVKQGIWSSNNCLQRCISKPWKSLNIPSLCGYITLYNFITLYNCMYIYISI